MDEKIKKPDVSQETSQQELAQCESVQNENVQNRTEQEDVSLYPSYLEQDKLTLRDFRKHLSGPVISIVIHLVILIIAGTVIISEPPPKEINEIQVEMKEVKPVPPPPPPPPEELPEEVSDLSEPTDVPQDRPQIQRTELSLAPSTQANVATSVNAVDVTVAPANLVVPMSNSQLKLAGLYQGRVGEGRLSAVKKYGGSGATEAAVSKALKWLATVQNEDGTWGDTDPAYAYHTVQLTCLALLAYLAHGDTPQTPEYGDNILKGLKKVTEWAEDAYRYKGVIRNDWYAHARVCIVLAEGYAITKIPALERAMNKAVETIVRNQNPIGGFWTGFDRVKKEPVYGSDLDLNSRLYNALYSAFAAGSEVQGLSEAVDKSLKCIEEIHNCSDGGFNRNMVRGAKGSKGIFEDTAAGTLYIYLMGGGESPAARTGLTWLEKYKPGDKERSELKMDWKNLPGTMSILGWYYMTQALFQGYSGTGPNWKKWNNSMVRTLVKEQMPEGYWPCPADKYPVYVLDPETKKKKERVMPESSFGGFSELNGKIWATVYFCMSLEVYYRYLPTFEVGKVGDKKPDTESSGTSGEEAEEDELTLD